MNIEDFFDINGNIDIIRCTKNINFKTVLDIGFGKGGASLFLQKKERRLHLLGRTQPHINILEMNLKNVELMSMIVQ